MFRKIRKRLTLMYTGIMALILLTFVVVGFAGFTGAIIYALQQGVLQVAKEEADEQLAVYRLEGHLIHDDENEKTGSTIFYYIDEVNGSLEAGTKPAADLQGPVRSLIQEGGVQAEVASLHHTELPDGSTAFFIIAAHHVYDNGHLIGTVYLGNDITWYYDTWKKLGLILLGGSLIFLAVAFFAGYFLAGRAMIPINQSFARQREFVADASHELRTPISVLLASVDAVQTDDDNKFSAFSRQVLADMKDEIRKMSKIVADLLTLARVDASVVELLRENLDMYVIAEHVIRFLQPLANAKNISLQLDCDRDIKISADRSRISQLLIILIDNAIKYTPDQGRVEVKLAVIYGHDAKLRISVRDNGIGIDEQHKTMIFERFYRVDKIRSRETGGTGLGLSIARWIVEAHKGTITVQSEPGKGSLFTVTLPVNA